MNKALEHTLYCLNHEYGAGTVNLASELPPIEAIPTGRPDLDAAGVVLPRGKIIEIYGPEDSGKTSLALQMARQAKASLYIDADHTLDLEAAKGLYLGCADTLEDALHMVAIAAAGFDMVVIDTLTAIPTRAEAEKAIGDFSAEPQSKVLSRCLPRLLGVLDRNRCTLVLVNQVRNKAGVFYGNTEHSTGGRVVKCFAASRLEVRTGQRAVQTVTVKKSRHSPPYRKVETEWQMMGEPIIREVVA